MLQEDPIVQSLDVYLSNSLSPNLYLIQCPNRSVPLDRPLPDDLPSIASVSVKANSRLVELELCTDTTHPTYSRNMERELKEKIGQGTVRMAASSRKDVATGEKTKGTPIDRTSLTGSAITNINATYMFGLLHEGALVLSPVNSIIELRPNLGYLDEIDAKTKATTKRIQEAENVAAGIDTEKAKAIQVQFRRKETEEQTAARLTSYSYLQRQVDDEQWQELSFCNSKSEISLSYANALTNTPRETIEFSTTPSNYINHLIN